RFADHPNYTHVHGDLADRQAVENLFAEHKPGRVVHLAAQAGVRYAAENPHVYVSSNVTGTLHILEGCRHHGIDHLVFASTSSVYGANTEMPFSEHQSTEHPLTLYAATKKANEQMAHSYAHLYNIPCTGLRFFTVYGPWGRPDMALFLFTKAILAGEPIKVFNRGKHKRSFTYIDDIVEGITRILDKPPSAVNEKTKKPKNQKTSGPDPATAASPAFEVPETGNRNPETVAFTEPGTRKPETVGPDPATSGVGPYRIFNIGNEQSVELMRYIEILEQSLGKKATKEYLPLQAGDVPATEASMAGLQEAVGYQPAIPVEEGIRKFVAWYRDYYDV
ncbi:MAG TPA: NAD-dependent epimerase/dehydratase family protein, partial [Tichowtungia sp.]|nr:NAD-dependent epimerase/dehydratase family protein [Tichowtungia sp.]